MLVGEYFLWAGGGETSVEFDAEGEEAGPITWAHEARVFYTNGKESKLQGFSENAVCMFDETCVSVFCTQCVWVPVGVE